MGKFKKIICLLTVLSSLFVFTDIANAATVMNQQRITGTTSGAYYWAFNWNYGFIYNSPGDGRITTAYNGTGSSMTCQVLPTAGGNQNCLIKVKQTSKSINSTKTAVTYGIQIDVYHQLGFAGYIYYKSESRTRTYSSPGPRSVPLVSDEGATTFVDEDLVGKTIE